jgi:hypothetical protein
MMIRMIKECSKIMKKHLSAFHENANKQLNEISVKIQDVNKEFNKDREILKKNQLKF